MAGSRRFNWTTSSSSSKNATNLEAIVDEPSDIDATGKSKSISPRQRASLRVLIEKQNREQTMKRLDLTPPEFSDSSRKLLLA